MQKPFVSVSVVMWLIAGGHGPRVASAGDDAKSEHETTKTLRVTIASRVRFATARQLAQRGKGRYWSARVPAALREIRPVFDYFLCEDAEPDGIGGGGGLCEPLAEPEAATTWPLSAEAGVIMKRNGTAARTRNAAAISEWRFMRWRA